MPHWLEWNKKYHSVTSYRGDQKFVQVGPKKVKAFNYFERVKMEDPVAELWCQHGATVTLRMCQKWLSEAWRQSQKGYPALLTTSLFQSGDVCPFASVQSVRTWARERRETVERDLFIKANAPVFEGAVFLAELTETITELRSILLGAIKGIKHAARARKTLKHLVLHPEELWLWYRYFLLPAMMDAEDIIAALKPRLKIDRVQDGFRSDGLQTMTGENSYTGTYGDCTLKWESKYRYSGGGAIDIIDRYDPCEWGTSAWDILRAGWEIIPFSFVFDWFIEVGDWLASLREIDLEIAQSYATIVVDAQTEIKSIDGDLWEQLGGKPYFKMFYMERVVDLEPPTTPLIDRNKLSLMRQIDAVSLTLGILRGIFTNKRI
jgi:hypothetical protein